jgi:hypothetical protein
MYTTQTTWRSARPNAQSLDRRYCAFDPGLKRNHIRAGYLDGGHCYRIADGLRLCLRRRLQLVVVAIGRDFRGLCHCRVFFTACTDRRDRLRRLTPPHQGAGAPYTCRSGTRVNALVARSENSRRCHAGRSHTWLATHFNGCPGWLPGREISGRN